MSFSFFIKKNIRNFVENYNLWNEFKVGGKNKGFSQIADKPNSYVIADNIESGIGNKIPMWLLGFLY